MAKIKIAIIGEGVNDYGIHGYDKDGNPKWKEGAVQPLVRKFFPDADFVPLYHSRDLRTLRTGGSSVRPFTRHASRLRPFLEDFAKLRESIDLLVFYRDLDTQSGGKKDKIEAKRSFREVMDDVENAFSFVKERFGITAIAMIPMHMLENWLLADEKAFAEHFGSKPQNPLLPSEPEFIWGDEQDRKSNHPKNYIQRVMEQYQEDATTENYILIAEAVDLATMQKRLPHSFAPFAEKMRNFMAQHP